MRTAVIRTAMNPFMLTAFVKIPLFFPLGIENLDHLVADIRAFDFVAAAGRRTALGRIIDENSPRNVSSRNCFWFW